MSLTLRKSTEQIPTQAWTYRQCISLVSLSWWLWICTGGYLTAAAVLFKQCFISVKFCAWTSDHSIIYMSYMTDLSNFQVIKNQLSTYPVVQLNTRITFFTLITSSLYSDEFHNHVACKKSLQQISWELSWTLQMFCSANLHSEKFQRCICFHAYSNYYHCHHDIWHDSMSPVLSRNQLNKYMETISIFAS